MLSLGLVLLVLWPWQSLFAAFGFVLLLVLLRRGFRNTPRERRGRRFAYGALIGLCLLSPYIAYKAWDLRLAFARVPEPLHSRWIEYRNEVSFGAGFLPGDNETGFVVYRLTDASARWARDQGDDLRRLLPGGEKGWHATPVGGADDTEGWLEECLGIAVTCRNRADVPTVAGYTGKYGFSIHLDDEAEAEVNAAIQSKGAIYRYGRGGSVTIVDPGHGKVYFLYAG